MLEAIIVVIGIIAGSTLLYSPKTEVPKVNPSAALMRECSQACGEDRMQSYSISYGKCKCILNRK